MSRNTWIIFGAVCLVLFGGLVFWSGRDRVDVSNVDPTKILEPSDESGDIGDRVFGNKSSKVVLTEYGDFQCPGCGNLHPTIKAITEKYEGQMAFVYRNYPLIDRHPNARAAAAAAESAGILGKYWEMHNIIFERQAEWSEASVTDRSDRFADYAEEIGLNREKFLQTLEDRNSDISQKINLDISLGRKVKVSGTPTVILNGKTLETSAYQDEVSLERTLQAEFQKQGVDLPDEEE